MRDMFSSMDAYEQSDFYRNLPPKLPQRSNRALKSLRVEDYIYRDARGPVDDQLTCLEEANRDKYPLIGDLTRDVFQAFYSMQPRFRPEEELSPFARKMSRHILDDVMRSEDYDIIKATCEGKPYPTMEATLEFMERVCDRLDELMDAANGSNNALNTLDKQEKAQDQRLDDLAALQQQRQNAPAPSPALDKKLLQTANRAAGKVKQLAAIGQMVDDNLQQHKEAVAAIVADAAKAAAQRADEAQSIILSWGTDAGEGADMPENRELVNRVRENQLLCDVAKYLGRLKEMMNKLRKNSFVFGRGDKYSLTLGNDLKSLISSEFSMLAHPDTVPLFLRKHGQKALKQYERRERIYKGGGDIICCLDESASTMGDNAAWGKAVALALADVARYDKRKFALVHFSSYNEIRTDVFLPGQYGQNDLMESAAHFFFGGGTDFEAPMKEAVRLIEKDGFTNADIVFITDGECRMPDDFVAQLKAKQAGLSFTVTGVLMDQDSPGMAFSLQPFCNDIYRVSEIGGDSIAETLLSKRIA